MSARITLSLFFVGAVAAGAIAQELVEGCLFSETSDDASVEDCSDDPLDLTSLTSVQAALEGLGLTETRISFRGCDAAPFKTERLVTGGYRITYPLLADAAPEDYLAPIAHELAHVFQLQLAGSYRALMDRYGSIQIELAADYLTGILLRNYIGDLDRSRFQQNMRLIGRYYEDDSQAHGTPEERVSAFRTGFFLDYGGDIAAADQLFHDDYFYTVHDGR